MEGQKLVGIWFVCRILEFVVNYSDFDVLLTVHISIFILVINQLDAQNFVLQ